MDEDLLQKSHSNSSKGSLDINNGLTLDNILDNNQIINTGIFKIYCLLCINKRKYILQNKVIIAN